MANHPNVVGDGDLEWDEQSHGEKFGFRRKQLSRAADGEKLGCSLYEVLPGRRAWPYHYHLANEEALVGRRRSTYRTSSTRSPSWGTTGSGGGERATSSRGR